MRAETLKGHLDGILLAVLEPGPRHGYAIMEALRVRSDGKVDLPTGTLYPALHRLERAGLIQATWSEGGGRRRRVYELTSAGRQALDTERSTWRDFSVVVSTLLQPATIVVSPL
jgi:PadR family transcriptional regulator PadR